jgi:hypothetical protein
MSDLTENTCSVSISTFQVFVDLPGASVIKVFLVAQVKEDIILILKHFSH